MTRTRRARAELLTTDEATVSIAERSGPVTRGILFIGDPHVSTRGPKRRLEQDWLGLTLDKLAQAVAIANERQLQPVCPGDLVDDPRDLNQILQVRLIRTLREFERRMATTVGNHDKKNTQLADDEVLTLLGAAGVVDLMAVSGFWGRTTLTSEEGETHRLLIGMTPYGFQVPTSLAQAMGLPEDTDPADARAQAQADTVLWITHADYAFEGAYPGAAELVEIPGIDMVINGHMHGVKKPVVKGQTVWYCPGNIVRWSVDQADHVPAVWAWSPFDTETMPSISGVRVPRLECIALRHTPGAQAFDFEGRHSEASTLDDDAIAPLLPRAPSRFVSELSLQPQIRNDADRGSQLQEELQQIFTDLAVPAAAKTVIERLAEDALHHLQENET